MRVAMISEHASPLAVLGGVDAGGQNVYVRLAASAFSTYADTIQMDVTVENLVAPLHWIGPDGRILWANQAELDMLGARAPENRAEQAHNDLMKLRRAG